MGFISVKNLQNVYGEEKEKVTYDKNIKQGREGKGK
jgi:hypothetical protein